jgi:lipopolysaccharide export system permease protein
MSLIRRVFYKELLWSILAVLLGFLMLFITIDSFTELTQVGKKDYTLVTLVQIVLLKVPEYAYQLLPICVLIGSILALSSMAARSELVVWRVSGLSLMRLVRLIVGFGLILAALALYLGDAGIASAKRQAKEISGAALHRDQFFEDDGGYWSKQNLDTGSFRMINIRNVKDGKTLEGVNLYELTPDFKLNRIIEAKMATEQAKPGAWSLNDVRMIEIFPDQNGLATTSKETHIGEMQVDLAENTLNVIRNSEERNTNLTIVQLQERIQTLKVSGQSSRAYEVAYWQKIVYPFGIIVMLLLALPFAFMQTRKGGVGIRVFTGIMLGLLFFILTVMTQAIGGLVSISPILLASAPSVLFLAISVVWIHRVTRV